MGKTVERERERECDLSLLGDENNPDGHISLSGGTRHRTKVKGKDTLEKNAKDYDG